MKLISFIKSFFTDEKKETEPMKKLLIAGLGNIGDKYEHTRHNIGFKILNALAAKESAVFETNKLGDTASFRFKGKMFILLKPSTYMNLSGKAVAYWMQKENIAPENLLVVCDDINIPFGTLRLKPKGSDGGHNGLKDINAVLNSQNYARLRFGVGNEFSQGRQVDYVLGEWNDEEQKQLAERLDTSAELIKSFGVAGINNTMNAFNGK